MKNYLSTLANQITPYTAGEQPRDKKYIKLNTNENPYPPSPEVRQALMAIDTAELRLYSDPENTLLVDALAKKYNLDRGNIFASNGSDEVLAFCFPTFFDERGEGVAFADITYSFYPVYCNLFKIKQNIIPLKKDFSQDFDAYLKNDAQGIIIANPNAPTGIVAKKEDIENLVKSCGKLVIVDEAYADFSNESVADLVGKYENLLVVKTFSKSFSLAGIRCGFALGGEHLIDGLRRIKNSFNSYTVNYMTERLATKAVESADYYNAVNAEVVAERERFSQNLKSIGFNVLPSGANFVFASHGEFGAESLYQKLREKGVLVRYFNKDKINNFLRITIGTPEEMDIAFNIIKEIIS